MTTIICTVNRKQFRPERQTPLSKYMDFRPTGLLEYSLTPLFRKPVNRIAKYPDRLGPWGKLFRTENVLHLRGLNPGEARFSARPDRAWGPSSLLYNGYRLFPGAKMRPGRAADHSPSWTAAIMKE